MDPSISHSTRIKLISLIILIMFTSCLARENNCLSSGFNLFRFNKKVVGSGHVIKEEKMVSDFSKVVLSEQGDLFIDVGNRERLIVEAEENLQEYLFAEVNNATLEISKQPENITLVATHQIRYYLTMTNLECLIVKSSGDVVITKISGESFSVRIADSGNVVIKALQVGKLEADLTSSGDLVIDNGKADSQNIRLSSSGEYDGRNLESQNAIIEVSSSGKAAVKVKESLFVDISSSGDVLYLGNPAIKIQAMSSTGRVRRMP
jgi:hypothetical protein